MEHKLRYGMREQPIAPPLHHVTPVLKRMGLNKKLELVKEPKRNGRNIDKSGYVE